jgi:hypothetical protein
MDNPPPGILPHTVAAAQARQAKWNTGVVGYGHASRPYLGLLLPRRQAKKNPRSFTLLFGGEVTM